MSTKATLDLSRHEKIVVDGNTLRVETQGYDVIEIADNKDAWGYRMTVRLTSMQQLTLAAALMTAALRQE